MCLNDNRGNVIGKHVADVLGELKYIGIVGVEGAAGDIRPVHYFLDRYGVYIALFTDEFREGLADGRLGLFYASVHFKTSF